MISTTQYPPESSLLPTPVAASQAAPDGGAWRGCKLRLDLWVKHGFKAMCFNAAARDGVPFPVWAMAALEAACATAPAPRCSRCGSEMHQVFPVEGDSYFTCVICELRDQLDDQRARVARLESEMEVNGLEVL